MYKRNAQGWSKHLDFFILDEIVLQIAFSITSLIRLNYIPYTTAEYRSLGVVFLLSDAIVQMLFNTMHNVIKRGPARELWETLKHCFIVFLAQQHTCLLDKREKHTRDWFLCIHLASI